MCTSPLVVVVSDFEDDYYHGVMKGVIKSISSNVDFIDLNINTRFNPISTSWALKNSIQFFPEKTIYLVVVDPGVGTKRPPLLVETMGCYFVLPDNGIIQPLVDSESKIIRISQSDNTSMTFHGRDIFAPIAGKLANQIVSGSIHLESFGSIHKEDIVPLEIDLEISSSIGNVVYIDVFGNLVTNLRSRNINKGDEVRIQLNDTLYTFEYYTNFDTGPDDTPFIIEGSCKTLEIVERKGSAYETLDVKIGTRLKVV